ncbi:MAG: putative metal-binding motif-containing protein, partial [Candidatus Woesearchaeota archaeon]
MLYNKINIEKRIINLFSWILFILIIILVSLNTSYFINVKAQENNETINNITNNILNQTLNQTENQIFLNSTLIVLHSNNSYVNESIKFYAYYKNESNNIIFGNCTIKIDNQTNIMVYNQTYYYIEEIFNSNKTYNYFVNCSSFIYLPKNISGLINISLNFNQTTLINQNNSNQNYTNNNTTNNNITNIFDKDNDGFTNETDCNDENPNINPGKKEILYNNLDDDCNPLTTDYIILNINTDKNNYNANEVVKINFYALNYSDTYLTINTPTNVSYVYIFSNKSYPLEQNFSLTTINGKYTIEAINYYENYSIQKIIDFNVSSDFNVDIEANQTEAYEN